MNENPLGGICCPEGQVNDGGKCADNCSPERPVITEDKPGICQCPNSMVMYSFRGQAKCCNEGQVLSEGECEDRCPAGMPLPVDGICSCGNGMVEYGIDPKDGDGVLCCQEGELNLKGACVDT